MWISVSEKGCALCGLRTCNYLALEPSYRFPFPTLSTRPTATYLTLSYFRASVLVLVSAWSKGVFGTENFVACHSLCTYPNAFVTDPGSGKEGGS